MLRMIAQSLFAKRHEDLHGLSGWLLRNARLWYLAAREFGRDHCIERASTLAYATVVSLIPLGVLFFSFAVQLGAGERVIEYAREKILPLAAPDFQETLSAWIDQNISKDAFARGLVGLVGVVALVGLVLAALGIVVTAERNFNRVWKVDESRTYVQKLTIFWVVLTTSPFILTVSAGIERMILPAGGVLRRAVEGSLPLQTLYSFLVPVSVGFLGFTVLYVYLPNTRVHLRSAVLGGVVAAMLWVLATRTFYLHVARTSSVYGSLAIFPLFLLWIYLNWAIVLWGCEVAYVHQNLRFVTEAYQHGKAGRRMPAAYVGFSILESICRSYAEGARPRSAVDLAKQLHIAAATIEDVARVLADRGVLGVSSAEPRSYFLAVAPERILLSDVVRWLPGEAAPDDRPADAAARATAMFREAQEAFLSRFEGRTAADLTG